MRIMAARLKSIRRLARVYPETGIAIGTVAAARPLSMPLSALFHVGLLQASCPPLQKETPLNHRLGISR